MSDAASAAVPGGGVDFGIEHILAEIERIADPSMKSLVRELVASILDLHAAGLRRMLEIVSAAHPDGSVGNAFEQDVLVRALLTLHDLSTLPPPQRIRRALEELQPYLRQTGATATLLRLEEDAVQVQLSVPGNADEAAVEHVRRRIELALMESVPAVDCIEIMVRRSAVGLIPVSALTGTESRTCK
jgi:hypothetical protein